MVCGLDRTEEREEEGEQREKEEIVAAAVGVGGGLGFGPVREEEEEQRMMRWLEKDEKGSLWSRCWESSCRHGLEVGLSSNGPKQVGLGRPVRGGVGLDRLGG